MDPVDQDNSEQSPKRNIPTKKVKAEPIFGKVSFLFTYFLFIIPFLLIAIDSSSPDGPSFYCETDYSSF